MFNGSAIIRMLKAWGRVLLVADCIIIFIQSAAESACKDICTDQSNQLWTALSVIILRQIRTLFNKYILCPPKSLFYLVRVFDHGAPRNIACFFVLLCAIIYPVKYRKLRYSCNEADMFIASLNGNIFRVTVPLCAESSSHFPHKGTVTRTFDPSFLSV